MSFVVSLAKNPAARCLAVIGQHRQSNALGPRKTVQHRITTQVPLLLFLADRGSVVFVVIEHTNVTFTSFRPAINKRLPAPGPETSPASSIRHYMRIGSNKKKLKKKTQNVKISV